MPAERLISDLASFRYSPARRAHSKTQQQVGNGESAVVVPSGERDNDPISPQEPTDFSKCKRTPPQDRSTLNETTNRRDLLPCNTLRARRVPHRRRQARPGTPLGRLRLDTHDPPGQSIDLQRRMPRTGHRLTALRRRGITQ